MELVDLKPEHVQEASLLALVNYEEERLQTPILPSMPFLPDLSPFVQNGLGVAAFDSGRMIGFLGCFTPWDHAFGSQAKGTFSPMHAHGAAVEHRSSIYQRMYQYAAEKWVRKQIAYHAIALYAHDQDAVQSLFRVGFGLRCVDAVRPMKVPEAAESSGLTYRELTKEEIPLVRSLREELRKHLGKSPCFMSITPQELDQEILEQEKRNTRIFVASEQNKIIAYLEIAESGENFATEAKDMRSIKGAYCLPEYRGHKRYLGLLAHVIGVLKAEGFVRLGVDFESINPAGSGFWLKHFDAYTFSLVRRIEECALL